MNTYYEITAKCEDGTKEVLFGSFDKAEVKSELTECKQGWKWDGYKSFKIEPRQTEEKPDQEIYNNIVDTDLLNKFVRSLSEGDLSEYIQDELITVNDDVFFVNDESILEEIKAFEKRINSGLMTSHELWLQQAPSFNFELDEKQLLEKAINNGFVIPALLGDKTYYLENHNYNCDCPDQANTQAAQLTSIDEIITLLKSETKYFRNKLVCNGGFDFYLTFQDGSRVFASLGCAGQFFTTNLIKIETHIKRQRWSL